jgi:uridylate kinase
MEPVVLSLGGSVLVREMSNTSYIKKLAKVLIEVSKKRQLFVVTGGGRIARFYIHVGRTLGADESFLDEIGIEVTRLNARLLITALGEHAFHAPPRNYDDALQAANARRIVVMGGVSPGITTDAVSALLAERAKAKRLVNATSVDGAYTADPEKDPKAKRIPRTTYRALLKLVSATPGGAGPNTVFEALGLRVLARSKIPLSIVDGTDLGNLKSALLGEKFHGTLVD